MSGVPLVNVATFWPGLLAFHRLTLSFCGSRSLIYSISYDIHEVRLHRTAGPISPLFFSVSACLRTFTHIHSAAGAYVLVFHALPLSLMRSALTFQLLGHLRDLELLL